MDQVCQSDHFWTAKGGWYRFKIEMYRNDQFPLTVSSVHSHPFPIRIPDRSTALSVAKTSSVIGQPLGTRVIKHVTEIAMSVYDSICPSYFQSCYVTLYYISISWNSLPKRQPFGRNFKDLKDSRFHVPMNSWRTWGDSPAGWWETTRGWYPCSRRCRRQSLQAIASLVEATAKKGSSWKVFGENAQR